MHIDTSSRQQEPGKGETCPVNLWAVVLAAIESNTKTARLVIILVPVLAVLGGLVYLGVRIWP